MENKRVQLRFRAVSRNIYNAILDGSKKLETRAATTKFKNLKVGDIITLVCGKDKTEKKIKKVKIYKTIDDLVKENKVKSINPDLKTKEEL